MPHLLQNYVDTQFQWTTKLTPHVPQNVHFKSRCCICKTHEQASDKVFDRYDQGADPDCSLTNFCQHNMKNF